MKKNNQPPNKAIPEQYRIFRNQVVKGELPVSREILLEMERIDQRILDPNIYYFQEPVDGFIRFCEDELTKTDGSPIKVLDSFRLWAEQLLGWYYLSPKMVYVDDEKGSGFVEKIVFKRLINKQYLIVARGGAKTMYQSFLQAYFLIIDPETSHQITVAPTMRQAEEVLSPIRTAMTRAQGPLIKFLTTQISGLKNNRSNIKTLLTPTKKGIEYFVTGSLLEIRPMSIDKLQGLRPKISTVDEWLSGDIREDVISAIEQGASKLEEWMIIAVSSMGTVRNGSGDDILLELSKILKGDYNDPHTSIFMYKMDDVEEVRDPKLWIKAQPNLGITVSYETYHRDVSRAENSPSSRNDILAKRFGLPLEGHTYFFTYEETLLHPYRSYSNMACAMGVDLSQGDDFCSFTFLFPLNNGAFGIKSISFISKRTLHKLPPAIRSKYEEFINEKSLIVLEGSVLDMTEVYNTLEEEILLRNYMVMCVGYDPYNAETFVKLWSERNGVYGLEIVRQGSRTESVPLGEIKDMAEDKLLQFDEKIFMFAMGNTMVLVDNNGNRKLYKRRYEHKIDPVSALMDAYVSYTLHPEMF